MFGILLKERPAPRALTIPKPSEAASALEAEYNATAERLGLSFRTGRTSALGKWLADNDYPTFHIGEVIAYMDRISRRDNPQRTGWVWVALRQQDVLPHAWGKESSIRSLGGGEVGRVRSDYYHSHDAQCNGPYNHSVPLSALRKIDAIERGLGKGKVAFMVSDYNTRAGWNPDPFLLAISRDTSARHVIDFWDEPGFGLEAMLGVK